MKWSLFTGSREPVNTQVEKDVRFYVREVVQKGRGVLTGGAAGVDYFVMSECVDLGQIAKLRIILPAKLEVFVEHYNQAAAQNKIKRDTCDRLLNLLLKIQKESPVSILEMPFKQITLPEYFARDEEEVKYADKVYAFQVNNSVGTGHTVGKAIQAGLPIVVHNKYTI